MKIIRQLIPVYLCFLFTSLVSGQISGGTKATPTILFKITREGSRHTSYLFGTHHAFGKAFFDSLNSANTALALCDVLIKENLNLPGHTAEEIINKRTTTTDWKRYFDKKDLAFVQELFASSPTDLNKMTPTEMHVFLSRYFKQQVCLEKDPDDTSLSLDDHIGSLAGELDMELVGLETTEEQIALINQDVQGMPRKVHKRRLAGIIDRVRTGNPNNCEETGWYVRMDIDYQLEEPCRNTLVLTDRNNKWMGTITEMLQTNNCFIAVGLSHLMYDCGLISKLRTLGYSVTPLEVR